MFDLNLNKKPALTIAKRFSRENTNDFGDQLNISVGTMVIMEFKKFMFLVTQELKRKKACTGEVTSPFSAPPLIAKAWDLVLLYTKHYEAFSKFLLGTEENAWIDKPPQNMGWKRY